MIRFCLADKSHLMQLAHMRWEYWVENGSDIKKQSKEDFVDGFVSTLADSLNRHWYVWCAIEDGRILSHVYIQRVQKVPKPSAPADAFGYVTNVYTRPPYRSKGIGSKLLSNVQDWALEMDLEFLVLWPSERSIPFWRRSNFDVDDPLVRKIRPYVN